MKLSLGTLVGILFFLSSGPATAQLAHLGEDLRTNGNGYTKNAVITEANKYSQSNFASGLAQLQGKYYFATPNGRLYETDGTLAGTRTLVSYGGPSISFVKATNKFLYFNASSGYGNWVRQFDPTTRGIRTLVVETEKSKDLTMNDFLVPSRLGPVDQSFISYEKDRILFRNTIDRSIRIRTIHDDQPTRVLEAAYAPFGTDKYPNYMAWLDTQVESIRKEIFWNGLAYGFDKKAGENSITSSKLNNETPPIYKYENNYELLAKGFFVKPGFLRTANGLYVMVYDRNVPDKANWLLVALNQTSLLVASAGIPGPPSNSFATVLDGNIYMAVNGSFYKYNETTKGLQPIINVPQNTFKRVFEAAGLLKAQEYIMFRHGDSLGVFNEKSRQLNIIRKPPVYPLTAAYNPEGYHAFAGNKAFYYVSDVAGSPIINQYDPSTGTTKMISFPMLKKEKIVAIRAMMNIGGFFVFLTEYSGTKKYGPSYQLFSYKEEL